MTPAAERHASAIVRPLGFAKLALATDAKVVSHVRGFAAWVTSARDAWQ